MMSQSNEKGEAIKFDFRVSGFSRGAIVQSALAAVLVAVIVGTSTANAALSVIVGAPPPPALHYERVPDLRPGYAGAWDGRRYAWRHGHQIAQRRGYR